MTEMHVRWSGRPSRLPGWPPTDSIRGVNDHGARTLARAVGLHYRTDAARGCRRARSGAGFRYIDPRGEPIDDAAVIARIRSIAIPPAWTDVWISHDPNGHLLATGRDARGRKVYRYHRRFRSVMDEAKFSRLVEFGRRVPQIRRRVRADLRGRGLPAEVVLAAAVRLLELTLIRIGNEEYARANGSVGLTTLRRRNVSVDGSRITFRFRGKAGRHHDVEISDRRLAAVVERLLALRGPQLFRYVDEEGDVRRITSRQVNDYLRDVAGLDVTAKDYRTWYATVLAYRALAAAPSAASGRAARRVVNAAVSAVADRLGNSAAIAKASYVHPAVVEAFVEDELPNSAPAPTATPREAAADSPRPTSNRPTRAEARVEAPRPTDLTRRDELAVLRLLEGSGGSLRRPAAP